jgi:hypothetical protein
MKRWKVLSLIAILIVAAGWKFWLLWMDVFPFNSDEAVVALMARHILAGERPLFFYGQAYMGSLDAYLVAAGFSLLGQHVWVIRAIQTLLYLATIITTVWIGHLALGSMEIGLVAGCLMAIPTVNVTLYTTVSLGGYGEALLIGNLILIAGFSFLLNLKKIADNGQFLGLNKNWQMALVLGFLIGLGFWANALTIIYSIPVGIAIAWWLVKQHQNVRIRPIPIIVLPGLAGFGLGSLPWWIYAIQPGPKNLLIELTGSAVAVEKVSWLSRVVNHLIYYFVLGGTVTLGLRPPWEVRWLVVYLIPIVLIFWGWVIYFWAKQLRIGNRNRVGYALLAGVFLTMAAGYIFTSFGVDPSGRYFIPLAVPLSLVASGFITSLSSKISKIVLPCLVLLLVGFNGVGTWQCAQRFPPGITTQFDLSTAIDHRQDNKLIEFLLANGEYYGYSNYWVSYPIAFLSQERLVFLPGLPYHQDLRYTTRDDRYAPYRELVNNSTQVAYITTNNPALDQLLIRALNQKNITWLEKRIGDYHIFYHLSAPFRLVELQLGEFQQ